MKNGLTAVTGVLYGPRGIVMWMWTMIVHFVLFRTRFVSKSKSSMVYWHFTPNTFVSVYFSLLLLEPEMRKNQEKISQINTRPDRILPKSCAKCELNRWQWVRVSSLGRLHTHTLNPMPIEMNRYAQPIKMICATYAVCVRMIWLKCRDLWARATISAYCVLHKQRQYASVQQSSKVKAKHTSRRQTRVKLESYSMRFANEQMNFFQNFKIYRKRISTAQHGQRRWAELIWRSFYCLPRHPNPKRFYVREKRKYMQCSSVQKKMEQQKINAFSRLVRCRQRSSIKSHE